VPSSEAEHETPRYREIKGVPPAVFRYQIFRGALGHNKQQVATVMRRAARLNGPYEYK
jgi:hypothetical protein